MYPACAQVESDALLPGSAKVRTVIDNMPSFSESCCAHVSMWALGAKARMISPELLKAVNSLALVVAKRDALSDARLILFVHTSADKVQVGLGASGPIGHMITIWVGLGPDLELWPGFYQIRATWAECGPKWGQRWSMRTKARRFGPELAQDGPALHPVGRIRQVLAEAWPGLDQDHPKSCDVGRSWPEIDQV